MRQCDDDAATPEAIETRAHHRPRGVRGVAEEAPLEVGLVRPRCKREDEGPDECLRHAHERVAAHARGAVRAAVDDEAHSDGAPALRAPLIVRALRLRAVVEERHRVRELHGRVAYDCEAGGGHWDVDPRVSVRDVRARTVPRPDADAQALRRAERAGVDRERFADDGERAPGDKAIRRGRIAPPHRDVLPAPRAPLHLDAVHAAPDGEHHVAVESTAAIRNGGHPERGAGLPVRDAVEHDARRDVVAAQERIERPRARRHDVH